MNCVAFLLFFIYLLEHLRHTAVMKNGEDLYDRIWQSYDVIFPGYSVKGKTSIMSTGSKQKGKYLHIYEK